MAWVTALVADEQIEYRLAEHSGCYVQPGADVSDPQVDYRMETADAGGLVWIGSGLLAVGQISGTVLDGPGREAARMITSGFHPQTGERLVEPVLRAHPRSQLAGARLVDAIETAAAVAGVEPLDLFAGKAKQAMLWTRLIRMVQQKGERHRLQIDSLHRLARAAGVPLETVYEREELAEARAHQGKRVNVRVRAYDTVADLDKTTSTLWALLGEEYEGEFRDLVHQAKREAFAELERWIAYGVASEDGKMHRIATGGLLGWSVEHQSARPVDDTPGDPHLHLHLVIANMARCEDGEWRAIANGGTDLYRHAKAFDGLFKARVRALAHERFGMRYERDGRTGAWAVVGVPEDLREYFSRRAAQVDALAGADAGREEKLRVSAQTRHAKHDSGVIDLRALWRERAEGLGIDVDAMVAEAAPGPAAPGQSLGSDGPDGPRVPPPEEIAAEIFHPEKGLTAHEKEFSRAQALAAVADACPYGLPAGDLEGLTDRVLAVKGYAKSLPERGSKLMSSADRFTTQDLIDAEAQIRAQTKARFNDGSARLEPAAAQTAISIFEVTAGYSLSDEQRGAVERLLTAGHGIDALVGVAGAGKTSQMQACRIGWDAAGLTSVGASLSAVAADNLAEGSGIPSRTLASWMHRIKTGAGLTGIDVMVIDEGVMTDDRTLAVLLAEAARTGTKVVSVGDPQQLQAIGAGGGFAEIHRLVGGHTLTTNRRQRDATERAALAVWRTGPEGREKALAMLADGGRVHATDSADEARAQILSMWDVVRARWSDPYDMVSNLVVLATLNADVDRFNDGAQALRRAAGELGDQYTYAQPRGRRLTLAVGDLVRVRSNDYRSRRGEGPDVLNGYRAQVTAIDAQHRVQITWRRTGPGQVQHHQAWMTADQIAEGALSLGYAMTIASSQGLTVNTNLFYGLGADAFSLYPGITRGEFENHLWLPVAGLEDEATRLRLGEPRSEAELLVRAVDGCAEFLRQNQAAGMVSDLLHKPPEPFGPPAPTADDRFPAWDDRDTRPYGHLPASHLAAGADETERKAVAAERTAADKAREVTNRATEATAHPSQGQRAATETGTAMDRALRLATIAEQEARTAADAAKTAAQARQFCAALAKGAERGRIALRLAGTSRAEQQELITHYTRQAVEAEAEERRARTASQASRRDAWKAASTSPYAEYLREEGSPGTPPADPAQMRQQLETMRDRLPALAERIDTQLVDAVRHGRTQVVAMRARAQTLRADANALRTEQELRQRIVDKDPQRHLRESAARDAAMQQARRTTPAVRQPEPQGRVPVSTVPRPPGAGGR
ncbi:MobF family relaxase [Streptomyces sp. NPDC050428]|uniref:MobF family relaxase n=1 Tax=Streptomyces sp. NPDC050428 TaxID=3155757 RepID=UPI003430542F